MDVLILITIYVRVTYTHLAIWTNAPQITARFGDTIFYMDVTHLEGKQERSYLHMVITAYMYKDIKAYLYANVLMC